MKHFSFLKNISMVCLALGTMAGISSCISATSPSVVSKALKTNIAATVYSYNDASTPGGRECKPAGPLPERTASALASWLHYSTPKSFSYTYPQYYLELTSPNGRRMVWALCSDAHGNFVGVMVPGSRPAWDVPFAGGQIVYVCDKQHRKELSEAIMDSLKEYDEFRISCRRAAGLTHWTYLISAPTDENAKRLAKFKEAQAQAEAAKAKSAQSSMEEASSGSDEDLDLDSFGSGDDDSSDDISSDDSADSSDASDDSDDSED